MLIADETGFVKKGARSAGVQRQYSGTAGRTENCQAGVFLAYASAPGHALINRELYLPRSWAEDRERCREAGIPDETEFATKPQLTQAMISRALEAGVPFAWFTADEAYGQAKWLQAWLEERDVSYVTAIRRSDTFTMPEGERRADDLITAAPARSARRSHPARNTPGPGPDGAENASTRPASATISDEATPSHKCRCACARVSRPSLRREPSRARSGASSHAAPAPARTGRRCGPRPRDGSQSRSGMRTPRMRVRTSGPGSVVRAHRAGRPLRATRRVPPRTRARSRYPSRRRTVRQGDGGTGTRRRSPAGRAEPHEEGTRVNRTGQRPGDIAPAASHRDRVQHAVQI